MTKAFNKPGRVALSDDDADKDDEDVTAFGTGSGMFGGGAITFCEEPSASSAFEDDVSESVVDDGSK